MKKLILLKGLIGISIILYLIMHIGGDDIISVISGIHLFWFMILLVILLIPNIFGSLSIFVLLRAIDYQIRFTSIIRKYFVAWSISLFGLGNVGEFSLVLLLKRKGQAIGDTSAVLLLDKVITFTAVSIISAVGVYFLFGIVIAAEMLIIAFALVFVILIAVSSKKLRNVVKRVILRKYAHHFQGFYKTLRFLIHKKKSALFVNIIITFVKLFTTSLIIYIGFIAFNQTIDLKTVFFTHSITILSGLIPVTINGLGVREGVALFLYQTLAIDAAVIASVYLLLRTINLAIGSIIFLVGLKRFKRD